MNIKTISDLEKHCEENGYQKSNSPDSFRKISKNGYDTKITFSRESEWVRIVSNLDHWTFAEVFPINKMDKALQELADNWDEYEEIRLDPAK